MCPRDGDHGRGAATVALPEHALVIGPGARWFCAPGCAPVHLTRRKILRRLLCRLAEAHQSRAEGGLSVDDLLAAGWPGERIGRDAGVNRVRVALTTLRKLGLRNHLCSGRDGYLLTPELDIRQDPRTTPPPTI